MSTLPKCERCGCPIFKIDVGRDGGKIAACGCTEIIGPTDEDLPNYWIAPLEEYVDDVEGS